MTTFVKITNQDIYNEIQEIKKMKSTIRVNTWIGSTALTICGIIIGVILK